MTVETKAHINTETETLFAMLPPGTSLSSDRGGRYARKKPYAAYCTWPHDEILSDRSVSCHGTGNTIAEAIEEMMRELDLAKSKAAPLKSASAVKAKVLELIREHDAAPASFRAAVDDLRVADR